MHRVRLSARRSRRCAAHFDELLDVPLRAVLFAEEGSEAAAKLDETAYAQPALFAVEVALFRQLQEWGVEPDILLGHSIGELAAAHVSGVWSLEEACRVVAARGRLMQALPEGGAMVSLEASEAEVLALLEDAGVEIAGLNGPRSTVISGDAAAVMGLAEHFRLAGRRTTRLQVSHAFHSKRMEPMLEEFRTVVSSVSYGTPRLPIASNVTGRLATSEELCSAEYWVRQVRSPVRFLDGVRVLEAEGARASLERWSGRGVDGVGGGLPDGSIVAANGGGAASRGRRDVGGCCGARVFCTSMVLRWSGRRWWGRARAIGLLRSRPMRFSGSAIGWRPRRRVVTSRRLGCRRWRIRFWAPRRHWRTAVGFC